MRERKALIRLALRAIHLLPQAGEVKEYTPLPLAGGEARSAGEGQTYPYVMAMSQGYRIWPPKRPHPPRIRSAPSPEGKGLAVRYRPFSEILCASWEVVQRVASPLEKLPEGLMRSLQRHMHLPWSQGAGAST